MERTVTKYEYWFALLAQLGKVWLPTAARNACVGAMETSVAEYGFHARLFGAMGGVSASPPLP